MKIVNDRQEFLNSLDLKDKYCVEIGVFRGDFSKMILEKNPLYLYLIDPFEVNNERYKSGLTTAYSDGDDLRIVKARFKSEIVFGQVIVKKYYSYDIVNTFTDGFFDFIYLDASHLYEDVKRDLEQWYHKLKPFGSLCGHDYVDNEDFGVKKAVDEFCKKYGMEMFILNKNGGDFALV